MSRVGPLRVIAFLAFLLALAGAVAFSRVLNESLVPETLSLVPPDYSVTLITGPPNALVTELQKHFVNTADAGRVASFVSELKKIMDDRKEDGFDFDRPFTIGLGLGAGLPKVLLDSTERSGDEALDGFSFAHALPVMLLLPVNDAVATTKVVAGELEKKKKGKIVEPPSELKGLAPVQVDVPPTEDSATETPLPVLVAPLTGEKLVVLTTAPSSVHRGYGFRNEARNFLLSDDALLTAVQRTLRQPMATGTTIFGYWNAYDVPLIDSSGIAIEVTAEAIRGDFVVNAQRNGLKVLDRLLEQSSDLPSWVGALPMDTAAFLAIRDDELQPYFEMLQRFERLSNDVDETYLGLMQSIRQVGGLHRIVTAVIGFDRGLPELMLGIWADESELDAALLEYALGARRNRDMRILQAAAQEFALENDAALSGKQLAEAGFLQAEANGFLDAYTLTDEGWESHIAEKDLLEGGYLREYSGYAIRYLTPEVTANDRRVFDIPDIQATHDDRYRLAYARVEGTTWVATDAHEIESLIDRVRNESLALPDSAIYESSVPAFSRFDKVRGYVNVDQVVRLGLLSPEAEINDAVKRLLNEFRQHPGISIGVAGKGDRIAGTIVLTHRDGLVAP